MSRIARHRVWKHPDTHSIDYFFDQWRRQNPNALLLRIRKLSHRGQSARYQFVGYARQITIRTGSWDLSVDVRWRNKGRPMWDMLLSLDADFVIVDGGIVCTLCKHELGTAAPVFSSRASLYQDHLFEPLAEWIRDSLLKSTHIQLIWGRGIQAAELLSLGVRK